MPQENRRSRKIADQVKIEISWLIDRKIKDPGKGLVTITRVKLSPDLKLASVNFSVLGDQEQRKRSEIVLRRSTSFLRRELGMRLNLKYLPELRFYYDDSMEYAANISKIIKKIHENESNS